MVEAIHSLVASGAVTSYSLEVEQVHTQDPGWRHLVYVAPSADGIDKVFAAIAAAGQKRSAEENGAIGDAFAAVTVPNAHRDYFARVTNTAHK